MSELLILVDEHDRPWGKLDKQLVHELGMLHRAFSVFIFNSKGKLLLQQRADDKYHSGGLWTNSCCSHPRHGEEIADAVARRLMEEMGMMCNTGFAFSFIYKTKFDNGLTEHELDHVYFGRSDDQPVPNEAEVKDYKYVTMEELEVLITAHPFEYTEWLKICFSRVKDYYEETFKTNQSVSI